MRIVRFFSTDSVKGTKGYISSQKPYEWGKTALMFALSLGIFFLGYFSTHTRNNLLTIVAVLGCLPASKCLVSAIMYSRFKSTSQELQDTIDSHADGLDCLYDCVFTTRDKTYTVEHLTVRGNTIVGLMTNPKLKEEDAVKHLNTCLKVDRYKNVSIKLFSDVRKYTERLEQIKQLDNNEELTTGILRTLRSISL